MIECYLNFSHYFNNFLGKSALQMHFTGDYKKLRKMYSTYRKKQRKRHQKSDIFDKSEFSTVLFIITSPKAQSTL